MGRVGSVGLVASLAAVLVVGCRTSPDDPAERAAAEAAAAFESMTGRLVTTGDLVVDEPIAWTNQRAEGDRIGRQEAERFFRPGASYAEYPEPDGERSGLRLRWRWTQDADVGIIAVVDGYLVTTRSEDCDVSVEESDDPLTWHATIDCTDLTGVKPGGAPRQTVDTLHAELTYRLNP